MDQHPALDTTGTAIVETYDWQPAMSLNYWQACMTGNFTKGLKNTIPNLDHGWSNE